VGLEASLRIALLAIQGDRSLLPDFELDSVHDLDPRELLVLGIRYVVFDFDSTLANWGRRSLPDPSQSVVRSLLDAGIKVAIASNGYRGRFRKLNEAWQDDEVVFLGRCGKPDHRKLATFLEESGWDPQETLVIGDNVMADVAAARGAGCRAVLVRPWSWFEFPLTKIWRVLEDVHRIRLRREWRQIPHIGSGKPRGQWVAFPEIALVALVLGVVCFTHLPLISGPVPASEISSLQLGIAHDLNTGWPILASGEPERSLLGVGLLSFLPDKTRPGSAARALSGMALLGSALLTYALFRKNSGALTSAVLVSALWLSPAFLASAGELSPSILELFFALALIVAGGSVFTTGVLLFLALLNGLSAIALIPLVFAGAGKTRTRPTTAVVGVALLLACACWVMAITRESVPGPGWDPKAPEQGAVAFSAFTTPTSGQVRSVLFSLEHDVNRGLLGKSDVGLKFPVLVMAFVFTLPFLAQRSPGAVWYLLTRAGLALLLPGLFLRPMLLIVFLPFAFFSLGSVLARLVRGYAIPVFAVLLAFLIFTNAASTRRQVLLARRNYRANPELISLARTAPEALSREACISTSTPALFHLFSGLQTAAPMHVVSSPEVTHIVIPRTGAPSETCILQRTIMLCPK
jgi:HAD superfamily phosphatase (TIGR01668 family)